MFQLTIHSQSQLPQAAHRFLEAHSDFRLFAFYGGMGAGKTTFIKALCRALGSADNVTSPSFALINEYGTAQDALIYHFDFYRIKSLDEAFDLGYEDYFYSGNYCFIEWPEKVEALLPERYVRVEIGAEEDGTRILTATLV